MSAIFTILLNCKMTTYKSPMLNSRLNSDISLKYSADIARKGLSAIAQKGDGGVSTRLNANT